MFTKPGKMLLKLKKEAVTFSIIIFSLLLYTSSKGETKASNSSPVPKPYVPCEEKRKPEWNSLRPYQASPCKVPIVEEEQTLLCGKDFVASQTFKVDVNSPYCSCPSQYTTGEVKCHCNIDRELEISVNSFDSELPIAGNTELTPNDRGNSVAEDFKRLSDWINYLPPNPSKYSSLKDYYKAYQKWRGKTCAEVTIPIINIRVFFCFNDPLKPDFLSFLFPYIPYSSTEDRIGKLRLSDFIAEKSDDMEIKDLKTEWKSKLDDIRTKKTTAREGVLYFPHLEETAELATVLQSTFVPKDSMSDSKAQSIKSEDVEPVKQQAGCIILDSRYNPGDQLFGEQIDSISEKSKGAPSAKITYKAEFDCPAVWNCSSGNCVLEGECTKTAKFSSQVSTFTPLIDEVWSKTTAGYSSIFRKIMPKTGSNSPYEKIKDIPASTSVEYKVEGEDASSVTSNPQLYFPHLGGIYDYFLLGTQTALRPKGFGGSPAGLSSGQTIPEPDLANEYLSWYLNGTLYRAERNPLDHKKLEDLKRITTLSGPLNKLLPQEIQWRNKINTNTLNSQRNEKQQTGKADEVAVRMSQDRHNQIVACIKGIKIPGWIPFIGGTVIGGVPTSCSEKVFVSTKRENNNGGQTPPPQSCPNVPDSEIDEKYLRMKSNFKRMAETYGGCNLVDQCYNYVVLESKKAGVNPALSLTLWLHESGASNYCRYPGVEDFGVHTIPGQDIINQLSVWLQIAKNPNSACNWCYKKYPERWREPMQSFLHVYRYGTDKCDPNYGDQSFYNDMVTMFQWVCDPVANCVNENLTFKIKCPTDNTCP